MVAEIRFGLTACRQFDGAGHAPLELVVVIRVKNIMFAVVLVVHDHLDLAQALLQYLEGRNDFPVGPIGVCAPIHIHHSEVFARFPILLVDEGLQSCAVGAGFGAEDPVEGIFLCPLCGYPLPYPLLLFLEVFFSYRILFGRFIELCDHFDDCIEEMNRVREGVTKKTGDTQGNVYTGASQLSRERTSKSVTRRPPACHTGRTPSRARAWAISSPPVRIVDVPQTERPMLSGYSPCSCR